MQDYFTPFGQHVPHILFYGNTDYSILKALEAYYPTGTQSKYIMTLYCGTCKGIKNIREDIKLFSKQQLSPLILFKSVILYDAEYLTVDAQYSLRRSIEMYSRSTRFFILTKHKDKLLQPIRSRFIQIYVPDNPVVKINIPYNQIKHVMTKDIRAIDAVEELYGKGIYGEQLVVWLKHKVTHYDALRFQYKTLCKQLKNERFILLYLVCLFRNSKEL